MCARQNTEQSDHYKLGVVQWRGRRAALCLCAHKTRAVCESICLLVATIERAQRAIGQGARPAGAGCTSLGLIVAAFRAVRVCLVCEQNSLAVVVGTQTQVHWKKRLLCEPGARAHFLDNDAPSVVCGVCVFCPLGRRLFGNAKNVCVCASAHWQVVGASREPAP